MSRTAALPIYKTIYLLLRDLERMRLKMPKAHRHDLGEKAVSSALDCVRLVVGANASEDKRELLARLVVEIEVLWTWVRLLYDFRCISAGEFKTVAERLAEVQVQSDGWKRWADGQAKADLPVDVRMAGPRKSRKKIAFDGTE
jgi:hypothetical protein